MNQQTPPHNALLWIVTTGLFMQLLDATIINTALPAIAESLHVGSFELHFVVTAYSLTLAILAPAASWVADRFGTRRVFFCANVLFVLGSILCAQSTTLAALVMSRVVQGVGGAMLMPVGRLALLRAFPKDQYVAAITVVSIAGQVAPMIGPSLGGWLAQSTSWHWIFLINVPIGIVCALATWRYMSGSVQPFGKRFDVIGFALLGSAMGAAFLGIERPMVNIPRPAWAALLFAYAAIAVGCYLLHARSGKAVLFPLCLFHERSFRVGLSGNFFCRLGSGAVPFLLPMMMQLHLGYTPLEAGLCLLPVAVLGIVAKPIVQPLLRNLGYPRFLIINTVLLGASIIGFAAFSVDYPIVAMVIQLGFFGSVNSMQFAAMNSVTLRGLDDRMLSAGNSLFSMTLMLSMASGVAISSTLASWFAESDQHSSYGFRSTFVTLGIFTLLAAAIFSRLPKQDTAPTKSSGLVESRVTPKPVGDL